MISIVRKGIKVNKYTKFVAHGYMIEVIPDITDGDRPPVVIVHIQSMYRSVGPICRNHADFVESDYMKLEIKRSSPAESTVTEECDNALFKLHFKASFTGNVWSYKECTSGTLEIEITKK